MYTDAEQADSGAYKIEISNDSGAASCAFKMNVQGRSCVFSYMY